MGTSCWATRVGPPAPNPGGQDITWPISLVSTANVVPSLAFSTTTAIAECPDRSADLTARRKLTPGCTDTVRALVAPTANASCTVWFLALTAHPLMPNTANPLHSVTSRISDANSGRRATRRVASTQATLRGWLVMRPAVRSKRGRRRAATMPAAKARRPGANADNGSERVPDCPDTPATASSKKAAPAMAMTATSPAILHVEGRCDGLSDATAASAAPRSLLLPSATAPTPMTPPRSAPPNASSVNDAPTPGPKSAPAAAEATSQAMSKPAGTAVRTMATGSSRATTSVPLGRYPRSTASCTSGNRSAAVREATK